VDEAMEADSPSTTQAPIHLRPMSFAQTQPDGGAATTLGKLPRPLTRFFDREREVAAVADLLRQDDIRLVTLTGPGGVGKTRLALRVADETASIFADGVAFVELAPMRDPAHVLTAIAEVIGVPDLGLRPLRESLVSALGERDILLVLDNFEHVLSAALPVGELLRHCPHLRVLASSRAPLGVTGERLWPVAPLPLPPVGHSGPDYGPAVTLFVERAQAVTPDFQLCEANAATVIQICHQLDGLPLAIELAAARLRLYSPEALLQRLDRRLTLLMGGARDLPPRLRALETAIAWSYDLLTAEERRLLQWLAVCVGGFSLEAVEALGPAAAREPLPALQALVDQSLVTRSADEAGRVRFGMLETIREYAVARLAASGEEEAARDAHAAYFLAFAERHAPDPFRDDDVVERVAALVAEHANLLSAMDHLTASEAHDSRIRLAAALGLFWFVGSLYRVGRTYLERALAAPAATPAVEAVALAALGQLAAFQGDYPAAAAALARAEERATIAGEPRALAFVRCRQATLAGMQGDFAATQAWAVEAETLASASGDSPIAALARFLRARSLHDAGDLEHAETLLRELLRDSPPRYAAATYRYSLARIARQRGRQSEVLEQFAASLPHFLAMNDLWSVATCLEEIATALAHGGRPHAAARLYGAAAARRSTIEAPMLPQDIVTYQDGVNAARAALGSEAFSAAWDSGGLLAAAAAVVEAQAETALALESGALDQRFVPLPLDPFKLTSRELDVLRLIVAGRSDQQIADTLFISRRTASHHVSAIMTKLGARTRGEAAVRAVRAGLI
jgi:non-specific serine/threonine protein kinase